jgi:hypothetical protein
MTPSSQRLTDIRKKRAALYRLCRELHRTSSSDSGRPSDSNPGSSKTNSLGPSTTYDPKCWRPSDTAISSPSNSPRSKDRYSLTPIHLLPPAAHPFSDLPGLAKPVPRQSLFPFFGIGGPRPLSPPSGAPVTPTRGSSSHQPTPPPDRILRSQAQPPPDGRNPDPSSRGCRR